MQKETMDLLIEANPKLNPYENYSGRGMYGKTTAGVVGGTSDVLKAVAVIGRYPDDFFDSEEEKEAFWNDVEKGFYQDNMGFDKIFY